MSRSGSLNVGKSVIAEENYKTGTGNISRRSLPAVNIPTLERLQQQDPAQGIENFLYFSNSYLEVGNSFDGITKRSSKQTEKSLAYPALIHGFSCWWPLLGSTKSTPKKLKTTFLPR